MPRLPRHFVIPLVAFLISRAVILSVLWGANWEDWDVDLFGRYSENVLQAAREGKSLYSFAKIEYPPVALVPMVVPRLCAELIAPSDAPLKDRQRWYRFFFRLEVAVIDVLGFLLIAFLIERWFSSEPPRQRAERLMIPVLSGAFLFSTLYARIDYHLGLLIVVAMAMMRGRAHWMWSFLVLIIAVHFKIVPIALMPVIVLASMPMEVFNRSIQRIFLVGAGRTAIFMLILLLSGWLIFKAAGPESLDFFAYHRQRGIEVESMYAMPQLFASIFGAPVVFDLSFGSLNVQSALLSKVAPLAAMAVLGAITLVYFIRLCRKQSTPPGEGRVGQEAGDDFVRYTALMLTAFILTNKVFSPQYLLWLMPVLPLLPMANRPRRLLYVLFLVACVVTKLVGTVFTEHFIGEILERTDSMSIVSGPTPLGASLMLLRNVIMIVIAIMVTRHTLRPDNDVKTSV